MANILAKMNLYTPGEIQEVIARQAQKKRKRLKLSQQLLADKSGVSLGSVKRFERTGQVSLGSLLKIALVLDNLQDFESLFKDSGIPQSLDEILKGKK